MKQNDKDKCDETTKETIYRFDKNETLCKMHLDDLLESGEYTEEMLNYIKEKIDLSFLPISKLKNINMPIERIEKCLSIANDIIMKSNSTSEVFINMCEHQKNLSINELMVLGYFIGGKWSRQDAKYVKLYTKNKCKFLDENGGCSFQDTYERMCPNLDDDDCECYNLTVPQMKELEKFPINK